MSKSYCSALLLSAVALIHMGLAQAGAIDDAVRRGVLKVGTTPTYVPFEMTDKQGRIVGFEIDLLNVMSQALGVELELNAEASVLIQERMQDLAKQGIGSPDLGTPENQRRLAMGVFPVGAEIVPNPYNKIPGFYIQNHTFVPGFPEMAWPMIEWTLDTRYKHLHNMKPPTVKSIIVYSIPESRLTPALEHIESKWDEVTTFSLPTVSRDGKPPFIDVGVKGYSPFVDEAFDYLRGAILRVGGRFHPES